MIVKHAKAAARRWAIEEAGALPGFRGAFFHGSTTWLPDDAPLPAASDVDVMAVFAESGSRVKLGKVLYRGVILDPSGRLTGLQAVVAEEFAKRHWVYRRREPRRFAPCAPDPGLRRCVYGHRPCPVSPEDRPVDIRSDGLGAPGRAWQARGGAMSEPAEGLR